MPEEKHASPRKPRRYFLLIAVVIVVAGGLVRHILSTREPSYHGLYLSEWSQMESADQWLYPANRKQREEAVQAIRAIGPRAVPFLLNWLKQPVYLTQFGDSPSALRVHMESWLTNYEYYNDHIVPWLPDDYELPFHFSAVSDPYLPDLAYRGFSILGPLAQSAVPDLVALLGSTNTALKAAYCLQKIGPAAFPALTNTLTSTNTVAKIFALVGLESFGPDAVPSIVAMTQDTNRAVSGTAIEVLGQMGDAAQPSVPMLEQKLTDKNYAEFAAFALSKLGHLEPLLDALTNEQPEVRLAAAVGLNRELRLQGPVLWRPLYGPYLTHGGLDLWIGKEAAIAGSPLAAKHTIQLLLTNFDDPHPTVRALVADRLGDFRVKAWPALPALTHALSDPSELVRDSAAAALQKIDIQVADGGIIRGPRRERKIALEFTGHTFAEGGGTILDELAKHHARASFFLTGDFLDNRDFQPLIARIIREGHYLGPHSDKHVLGCSWEDKKTLISRTDFFRDILPNTHKIQEHEEEIVKRAALPPRPQFWLPAYEWYNEQMVAWGREVNLVLVNYTPGTRSNADYTGENDKNFVSSQAIYDSIVKQEREDPDGLNGFLLLLHVGVGPGRTDKFTDHYFGELLDYLAGRGYQFVRVDELLDPN